MVTEDNGSTFEWKNEIHKIYYDAKQAGSFYGPIKLYHVLKKKDKKCRLVDVLNWIRDQEVYNIHRYRKTRFERRLLVRLRPYETISIDSIYLQDLGRYNSNYCYIVTCICLFSNYGWAFPVKRRTMAESDAVLRPLFEELEGQIEHCITDKAPEYIHSSIFEEFGINRYSLTSELKAMHAEAWNKILENRIYRCLSSRMTLRWLDFLSDIVASYNSTPTRRLYGKSPEMCLVSPHKEFLKKKFKQERDAMEKKYVNVKNDITVGSYVYVVKPKKVFSRGF